MELKDFSFSSLLILLASLFEILAYLLYGKQMKKDSAGPGLIVLFLWFGESVLNTFTYFKMANEGILDILPVFTNPVLTIGLIILCFRKKKFEKPNWVDYFSLTLVTIIFLLWITTDIGDGSSNALLQIVFAISFFPVGYRIMENRKEHQSAWILAAISCALFAIAIGFEQEENKILCLLYPIVNGLGNMAIVLMIYLRNLKAECV